MQITRFQALIFLRTVRRALLSESDEISLHERCLQFIMHATLSVTEQIKASYLNADIYCTVVNTRSQARVIKYWT